MSISSIYLACQNIMIDTLFNVYRNENDYRHQEPPIYSGTYEFMVSELSEATIRKFFIRDVDGDVVDVLLY